MITSINQLDATQIYSYSDYLSWKFEQFIELFKGRIVPMAAPSRLHQDVSRKLNRYFDNFLLHKSCRLYYAPFDVRLVKNPLGKTEKEIYTVVQPDLCVICDLTKLDDKGCLGAPELIIEIVSPNAAQRDTKDKFELYQENGVLEYWIVRPYEKTVQRFYLENDIYVYKGTFSESESINPILFPDLVIDLNNIFDE